MQLEEGIPDGVEVYSVTRISSSIMQTNEQCISDPTLWHHMLTFAQAVQLRSLISDRTSYTGNNASHPSDGTMKWNFPC
jgi:hypothetical protein